MSTRFILFLSTALLIFGWRRWGVLDLILIVSAISVAWVFVWSRIRMTQADLLMLSLLGTITAYSFFIVSVNGGADLQVGLRSLRATINYAGAAAIVAAYRVYYGDRFAQTVLAHIFWAIAAHALLIVLMFLSPTLRLFVYGIVDTYAYINLNAPFLIGLRVSGLTYGLASTSLVQMIALLIYPMMLHYENRKLFRYFVLPLAFVLLNVSIMLTGRSGLVFAVLLFPIAYLFTTRFNSRLVGQIIGAATLISVTIYAASNFGPESWTIVLDRAYELTNLVVTGLEQNSTVQHLGTMVFFPEAWYEFLFGTSNLGRGQISYLPSDIGYVRLVFAIGFLGTFLTTIPYLATFIVAAKAYAQHKHVAIVAMLAVTAVLLFNAKELALLTRNQWSVIALIASVLFSLMREFGKQQSNVIDLNERGHRSSIQDFA